MKKDKIFLYISIFTLILFIISLNFSSQFRLFSQDDIQGIQSIVPVKLKPYSRIKSRRIKEASGIIKSRLWNDVYWTVNDSGNDPLIFPFNKAGEIIPPRWNAQLDGIHIHNAANVDWEAITIDHDGYLYIADIGNNANARRDLVIYKIREPYPRETALTTAVSRIFFYYPEQREFPAVRKNFDTEALFWRKEKLYVLTKNRSDDYTQLYELDPQVTESMQPAKLCEEFRIGQPVTDACYNPSERQLVVLTINSVWLFQAPTDDEKFFTGHIRWLPIEADQCEAICFDEDNLLILNEKGYLFQLPIHQLLPFTP